MFIKFVECAIEDPEPTLLLVQPVILDANVPFGIISDPVTVRVFHLDGILITKALLGGMSTLKTLTATSQLKIKIIIAVAATRSKKNNRRTGKAFREPRNFPGWLVFWLITFP